MIVPKTVDWYLGEFGVRLPFNDGLPNNSVASGSFKIRNFASLIANDAPAVRYSLTAALSVASRPFARVFPALTRYEAVPPVGKIKLVVNC